MKIILILIMWSAGLMAQSNSSQIKSQIRQILLLNTYIKYLEKGYEIAKKGLTVIGDIKKGDFQLHLVNFNSYKSINPLVKKYAKIADIIALQLDIIQVYKKTIAKIDRVDLFNAEAVSYVSTVFKTLLEQCGNNIDDLISVTTSATYQMKDDERIERINAVREAMQDKYQFALHFGQSAQVMAMQRNGSQHEVQTSQLLFNIKQP